MAVQPEPRHVVVAHRPKPVEIEILRNGKSSESVSFVNEAAANFDGAPKPAAHSHKAAVQADEDADAGADTADEASTTVASAPAPDHHDLASPMVKDVVAKDAVAPASAAAVTSDHMPADHTPTPKTIDIP
jgi:hypothetical protein